MSVTLILEFTKEEAYIVCALQCKDGIRDRGVAIRVSVLALVRPLQKDYLGADKGVISVRVDYLGVERNPGIHISRDVQNAPLLDRCNRSGQDRSHRAGKEDEVGKALHLESGSVLERMSDL